MEGSEYLADAIGKEVWIMCRDSEKIFGRIIATNITGILFAYLDVDEKPVRIFYTWHFIMWIEMPND